MDTEMLSIFRFVYGSILDRFSMDFGPKIDGKSVKNWSKN